MINLLRLAAALTVSSSAGQPATSVLPPFVPPPAATASAVPGHGGLGKERFEYAIKFGFIKVGSSWLDSTQTVEVGGRKAHYLVIEARSEPWLDKLYKVRDKNEAWLDAGTRASLGFGRHISEGNFFREEVVAFDHAQARYRGRKQKDRKAPPISIEGELTPGSYDLLSAIYLFRNMKLEPGKEFSVPVNTKKNWVLVAKVLQKKRLKVPFPPGELDCLEVEPQMEDEGIFLHSGKNFRIWVTDDPRRIPVKLEADFFVGAVTATLQKAVWTP